MQRMTLNQRENTRRIQAHELCAAHGCTTLQDATEQHRDLFRSLAEDSYNSKKIRVKRD